MQTLARPANALTATAVMLGVVTNAGAEEVELRQATPRVANAEAAAVDRFTLLARSETYLQLFRRALTPGPAGSLVTSDAASPLTEYLLVQARDADAPWQKDSVDAEVGAWGQVWPTRSGYERPFDGDVQTANIGVRTGALAFRAGRQLQAGGAARFARFDGLAVTAHLPAGLYLTAYGGWAVLPRWDARPGYHQLGIAERELVPGQALSLARAPHWLTGWRVGYGSERINATASFHEQRESAGLEHRNLGLDASATLTPSLNAGGSWLYELDQRHVAEARAWLDVEPYSQLNVTLEGLRTKPALFLSRQSVLSVFGTSAYDEVGGALTWHALSPLRLETRGYFERYDTGRPGARCEGTARLELGNARRTAVRTGYARVIVGASGYHSVRVSLARTMTDRLAASLEAYGYFYDQAVLGYRTSAVYAGTLTYQALAPLELLWGASVFSSPYARLDAQTMLRVSYQFDATPRRNGR